MTFSLHKQLMELKQVRSWQSLMWAVWVTTIALYSMDLQMPVHPMTAEQPSMIE